MYEEACEIVPKEGAKVKRVIKIECASGFWVDDNGSTFG
jgi:hypothetical protein